MLDGCDLSILSFINLDNGSYLLNLELEGRNWYDSIDGILVLMTSKGEIKGWLRSNYESKFINPHGAIYRELRISKNKIITIHEVSYGDNTDRYMCDVKFVIIKNQFHKIGTKYIK